MKCKNLYESCFTTQFVSHRQLTVRNLCTPTHVCTYVGILQHFKCLTMHLAMQDWKQSPHTSKLKHSSVNELRYWCWRHHLQKATSPLTIMHHAMHRQHSAVKTTFVTGESRFKKRTFQYTVYLGKTNSVNVHHETVALQKHCKCNGGTAGDLAINLRHCKKMLVMKQWHCRSPCNQTVALQECFWWKRGTAGDLAMRPRYCRNACNETVALQESLQSNRGTAGMLVMNLGHCRSPCNEVVTLQKHFKWNCGTAVTPAMKTWHCRNACNDNVAL